MGQGVGFPEYSVLSETSIVIHRCNRSETFYDCLSNPPVSGWIRSRTRRCIDIILAVSALLVLAAPMLVIGLCIRLTSRGHVFFSQERVGMRGRNFKIYKFRSMSEGNGKSQGPGLTQADDRRVTKMGRFMRKFKLDELPQFYNVLRGDMSLIGPRPKLPQYAAICNMPYRPGISGAATSVFHNEEELMRGIAQEDLDDFYAKNIMPIKARLDVCYMCQATPLSDLRAVTETLLGRIRSKSASEQEHVVAIPRPPSTVAAYKPMRQKSVATEDE